jgi:23S rRNA pseudouridine955/2504/2580 synthase
LCLGPEQLTQRSSHRRPKSEIGTVTNEEDVLIRSLLIHEDGEILVFNKPSGLAVQGGSGVKLDVDRLLWAFANRKGRRPKLVHRLDRETSGVLVVAKTTPAAAHLSAQFADRSTTKVYSALVSGRPQTDSGTIETPLVRINSGGIDLVRAARPHEAGAQLAKTEWRIAAGSAQASLIEAIPHTGRMHQIRAHLADLGHPIAGDTKYGGLFSIGAIMVPRLMLHAGSLSFMHPASGQSVTFDAALPDDYADVLTKLGISQT